MKKKNKPQAVIFKIEIYLKRAVGKVPAGNITIEKKVYGFKFLPTLGMGICLQGTDEIGSLVVGEVPWLYEDEYEFQWDIDLISKDLPKDRIPEVTTRQFKEVLKGGWTILNEFAKI